MHSLTLCELGWKPFFEKQVGEEEKCRHLLARVSAHFGSQIHFLTESGDASVPSSLIEKANDPEGSIAIGDWLLLSRDDHRVIRRLERKSELSRKAAGETVKSQVMATNVDTVFVVSSCNKEFSLSRLERYLAIILESRCLPVVVLTKSDLCDDPAELCQLAESLLPGLTVVSMDAREATQSTILQPWCVTGQTVALLGSSGVGKSTLANALGNHEIKTSSIRDDDDKGRHTTTARSMHRLVAGGWLIDNPGMRELQLPACEQGIDDLFDDVIQLTEACRFRNCSHRGDAGCALEAAVESGHLEQRRLTNYLKLQSEQARNSASLSERRERERKTGKLYKTIIAEKRDRRRDW